MGKKNIFAEKNWSKFIAYAVGLLTADGCLSSDGRHIEFTSKDEEQVKNFIKCLNLTNKITQKSRCKEKDKRYYHVQFGNIKFYRFLESIGLSPRKSKTIKRVNVPQKFFPDFLRGLFDGDGNFNIFTHPESQYPQIRTRFFSGSHQFLKWLQKEINDRLKTLGYITKNGDGEALEYAIRDSLRILKFMYHSLDTPRLSRKFEKAKPYLRT